MGDDLARYPALLGLFAEAGKPAALVDRLVGRLLPELAAHPLGQIPFRHQLSGGMAIIQLVAAGDAALCLVLYERSAAADSPQTVCFTDSERHEIALSGAGNLQIVERDTVSGWQGETVGLRFIERSTLSPGKLMLYRAHLDVHSQLAPEAMSVSLNVMGIDAAQGVARSILVRSSERYDQRGPEPHIDGDIPPAGRGAGRGRSTGFGGKFRRFSP